MKNATARLTGSFLLALLSATMAVPGCAGVFDKCVKPVASEITWTGTATELGEVVAGFLLCDPNFSGPDVPACALQSFDDLAKALGPKGQEIVNCIIAYYEGNGSAALQARAKAVGAKRGVSPQACRDGRPLAIDLDGTELGVRTSPSQAGLSSPAQQPGASPSSLVFSYTGETVWSAEKRCEIACGSRDAVGSPNGSCLCWRADRKNWRNSRWVSIADSPPGEHGPGVVGGGGA